MSTDDKDKAAENPVEPDDQGGDQNEQQEAGQTASPAPGGQPVKKARPINIPAAPNRFPCPVCGGPGRMIGGSDGDPPTRRYTCPKGHQWDVPLGN